MKKIFSMVLISLSFVAFMPTLTSCEKEGQEDNKPSASTVEIEKLIADCDVILKEATSDDYPQDAIDAFTKTLNTIKSAIKGNVSQKQVDNMTLQLQNAKETFLGKAYGAIAAENVIFSFNFDKEGETITSEGTVKLSATLATGPKEIFANNLVKPTFVEGVKGKAIHFSDGAHLEIANYNFNDICKDEITLAAWVKTDLTSPGNYIFSLNYWNTMKLQIQENGKPFMTVATEKGISDCDNQRDESAKPGEWSHIIVTVSLKAQEMKFYVNGELTQTWIGADKPALTGTAYKVYESPTGATLPILIGTATTYAEANAAWNWEWEKTPESWVAGNCMQGAIDNLALYNIALTDGQARGLYNKEK